MTRSPRHSRRLAIEADAMPFPSEETTPPVMNTNFGARHYRAAPRILDGTAPEALREGSMMRGSDSRPPLLSPATIPSPLAGPTRSLGTFQRSTQPSPVAASWRAIQVPRLATAEPAGLDRRLPSVARRGGRRVPVDPPLTGDRVARGNPGSGPGMPGCCGSGAFGALCSCRIQGLRVDSGLAGRVLDTGAILVASPVRLHWSSFA